MVTLEYNLLLGLIALLFTVLWYLLRQKDADQEREIVAMKDAQAKAIDLLWVKHDEDAARLAELQLEIARRHYVKDELDAKLVKLESSIRDGLNDLGAKFDKLSEVLIQRQTR